MRILLVDDEREEREGISFLIEKFHYPLEIFQASSSKEALEIIKKYRIDILFTDVKMPVMSGLELARIVRETDKNIKIIIFSAYAEFEYAKQAIEMNALRYLLKPIEIDEFKELMDDVLSSLEESQRMDQKELLFKLLSGKKLDKISKESIEKTIFCNSNVGYRFLNVEFLNNYFEENEEKFLQLSKRYLGNKTEYIGLYPNESYLLLMDCEANKFKIMNEQIEKMMAAIQRHTIDKCIMFISPMFFNLHEMEECLQKTEKMKSEIFGYENKIIEIDGRDVKTEHYVSDIETAANEVLSAIDSKNPDIISKKSFQLIQTINVSSKVSKLYVQNILYTIIKYMYDKLPGIEMEEVLISAESLFKARDSKKILEEYENIVKKIIIAFKNNDDEANIIFRIKKIVEREYMRDISLDYIAKQVHLAPAYVSFIFKQETGQSLIKYITDIKMAKARKFLEDKEMKIIQVGKACGYENQSYFNRLFKNYHGVTPKQYREQL